jgi:hypothetical protein
MADIKGTLDMRLGYPPASSRSTECLPLSVSRDATTEPAEPAPTWYKFQFNLFFK